MAAPHPLEQRASSTNSGASSVWPKPSLAADPLMGGLYNPLNAPTASKLAETIERIQREVTALKQLIALPTTGGALTLRDGLTGERHAVAASGYTLLQSRVKLDIVCAELAAAVKKATELTAKYAAAQKEHHLVVDGVVKMFADCASLKTPPAVAPAPAASPAPPASVTVGEVAPLTDPVEGFLKVTASQLGCEHGAEVIVVGSFCDWDPSQGLQMKWTKQHAYCNPVLPLGAHPIKFVVAGEWVVAQDLKTDTDGDTVNNILEFTLENVGNRSGKKAKSK